ncbi:hypothetical protein OG884_28380 [Streptosporangium sp. NBC_01755]|uniref:hypothetical protein n=1 Tax=Streptosporangium sp. NBC_01755 TaxID=2975949 RepID=UPI002DD8BE00|nr:hypothetical protein [Streptosporangium sp. NBC_01755]WSC98753.1 hypothetical protein OG884_28380 [Streptosporangium sp. NBC_01755]
MASTELLAALASAGATAIVSSVASDAWQSLRDRVARVLGRGDDRQEVIQGEVMDKVREAILQASSTDRPMIVAAQRERISALLAEAMAGDPVAAEETRSLIAEFAPTVDIESVSGGQHAHTEGDAQQAVQYTGVQTNTFKRD